MPALRTRLLPLIPIGAALLLYSAFWPAVTPDMTHSYAPWLEHIATIGPVRAFAVPFGDYTPPILYLLALASLGHGLLSTITLVKLASVAATALLTLSVVHLLRALRVDRPWTVAAFVPLLPGVALNASVMASDDALWAAPCIMALAAAVRRRPVAMLAWCGVALAVKQQAVCLAPFMFGLLVARRVPIRYWAAFPAGYLTMFVPAWLAGAPLVGAVGIYARQAGFYDQLALNAPNVWALVQVLPGAATLPLTGLALAAAIVASVWLAVRAARIGPDLPTFAATALLSPLLVVGLLPRMHERYFFLADVLALVWAAAARTRSATYDAVLVQAGSTLGILAYMSGASWLAMLGSLPMLLATGRVIRAATTVAAGDGGTRRHFARGSWPQFISE